MEVIRQILRHADRRVTAQRYAKPSTAQAKAMARLNHIFKTAGKAKSSESALCAHPNQRFKGQGDLVCSKKKETYRKAPPESKLCPSESVNPFVG